MTANKTESSRTMHPFIRALLWLSANTLVGFIPVGVLKWQASMSMEAGDKAFLTGKMIASFRDCGVMFLFCTLMTAVLLDFLLATYIKIREGRDHGIKYFGIMASPIALFFIVVTFYQTVLHYHEDPAKINYAYYAWSQGIIISCSIIYCLTVKTIIYSKEKEVK